MLIYIKSKNCIIKAGTVAVTEKDGKYVIGVEGAYSVMFSDCFVSKDAAIAALNDLYRRLESSKSAVGCID